MKAGHFYRQGENERWLVVFQVKPEPDYVTLTSGSIVEVNIGGHWIRTRVEHNGKDYYAVTQGVKLQTNLKARTPRPHDYD
jgi:hypothetical protein